MTLTLIPHFIHTIFFLRLYDAISCSLFYGRHVFLTSPMCHLHKIKGSVRKHSCSILRGKHDDYGLYYRLLPSALKPRMILPPFTFRFKAKNAAAKLPNYASRWSDRQGAKTEDIYHPTQAQLQRCRTRDRRS